MDSSQIFFLNFTILLVYLPRPYMKQSEILSLLIQT